MKTFGTLRVSTLPLLFAVACSGPCRAPCWLVPCPGGGPGGPGVDTDTDLPDTVVDTDAIDTPADTDLPPIVVQTEPETAFAVDIDRLIASVSWPAPDICPAPEVAGWTVRRLFYDVSTVPPDVVPVPSDNTTRLCLYERQDPTAPPPFLALTTTAVWPEQLQVGGADLVVVNDRVIVAPAALDEEGYADLLDQRFSWGAGLPERTAPFFPPSPTRLVIIDSVPDARFWPPDELGIFDEAASHGQWMAAFAQQITCPDGASGTNVCPVDLRTSQALGVKSPAYAGGAPGAWGTIGDLAVAIDRAVRAWESDRVVDPGLGPLVLNLSVGWHPYFGGGVDGAAEITGAGDWSGPDPWHAFPPDVQAVFLALARARCLGALTFAAAGNQSGGSVGTDGPLLPAGWDAFPSTLIPSCVGLNAGTTVPDARLPLVSAVGGINAVGASLSVARPESRPLLVADGAHARVAPGASALAVGSPVLVGTSVSTVVVSSTAALLWSLEQPGAAAVSPYSVLSQLAEGGAAQVAVGGAKVGEVSPWLEPSLANRFSGAVLHPTGAALAESRAVRVCDVLAASGITGWVCATPSYAPDLDFGAATLTADAVVSWPGPAETLPECGAELVYRVPEAGASPVVDPCPDQQYLSPVISPWVLPQPEAGGCGLCFLNPVIGRLYIKLPDLTDWSSYSVVIKSGTSNYSYAIPNSALPSGGDTFVLDFPPAALPAPIGQAGLVAKKADRVVIFPLAVTN